MQPTTKQPNGSFVTFLRSPQAWPVWIMISYVLAALAIAILATAAGLAFAAMNRPQLASGSQATHAASPHVIQHK